MRQEGLQKIINKMTLDEKISMLSGANFWNTKEIERLNIPSMMLTDGPHGLRKQGGKSDHLGLNASINATCFPTAATIANSWDKDLAFEMGKLLSVEAIKEDVSVLLGPGVNIKRNPLCGRNFEYFSEDPYLSGHMAANQIRGIESLGISSCIKHFAVNSQETLRMTIDEQVDMRALHEIYLEPFRIALKQKPQAIMTSYNKVNGVYANENQYLLKEVLRNKFDFNGLIVTDWGGNNNRVQGLQSGNQLEMPNSGEVTSIELKTAYENNQISLEMIDNAVYDLLKIVSKTKQAIRNNKDVVNNMYNQEKHHQKAVEFAEKSIVLLKNGVLPLRKNSNIGLIGDFAFKPRYQGAGSSLVNPTKIPSAIDIFQSDEYNLIGQQVGYKRYGIKSEKLKKQAVELAKKCEYVIYFMGLDEASETEGLDRFDLSVNQNQIDVLKAIHAVNENIIIVLAGGAPIELEFTKYAKSVLHTYLGGQGGAEAVYNIISGKVNPSGKLAETYAYKLSDILSTKYYPGNEVTSEHRESIYVGYRYFESANKEVQYPFGFGLSYTKFDYSNISVNETSVKFTIKNIGKYAGSEIAQFYVAKKDSNIFRAKKELKGFAKIHLLPAESKEVTIEFDEHTFSYFDIISKEWQQELGEYELQIGSSIKDIRLVAKIRLQDVVKAGNGIQATKANNTENLYNRQELTDYYNLTDTISKEQFEKLYGQKLEANKWDRTKKLELNDVIMQAEYQGILGKTIVGLLKVINKLLLKIDKPIIANYVYFLIYMPWKQVSRFSGGRISEKYVQKLLRVL